nr:hypothetical protein [Tanacetum cinerariifolium]
MHERLAGKIRLYTRFFDFANFRLPLSNSLVDILRHFRINIYQLSVIGEAKVSHIEILCHVYEIVPTVGLFWCFYVNSKKSGWMSFSKRFDNAIVCYTKPLDSLKNWNNRFFLVDDFACPASFSWHTAKHLIRDPFLVAADFNAQDYATLVAHPSPFWKFSEVILCLVRLSRHYPLDEETYPRFVHKNEEGGCLLLYLCYVFYDFVMSLLIIRLFCSDMDLFDFIHASDLTKVRVVEREREVDEPRLLDTTIGRTVSLLSVAPDRADSELEASVERLFDGGGSGTQTEEDHGTPSGTFVVGKFQSSLQRFLVGAVLNAKVWVTAIRTLPFVTASVSTTPEREDGDHTDFVAEPNLCTIGAPQGFVISSDSSHHSSTNVAEAEVDSLIMSSAPIMTTVTTTTLTVDPTFVTK